jgi:transposase
VRHLRKCWKYCISRVARDDSCSHEEAARRFGLDRKTVRTWCRRWQAAGLVDLMSRYPPIRAPCIAESPVALIEHARREFDYAAVHTRIWLDRVH